MAAVPITIVSSVETHPVMDPPQPDVALPVSAIVDDVPKATGNPPEVPPPPAAPVRLTLVIKPTAHKKGRKGKEIVADTVVSYTNPHDHFVRRAYRHLKEAVSPKMLEFINMFLAKMTSTSKISHMITASVSNLFEKLTRVEPKLEQKKSMPSELILFTEKYIYDFFCRPEQLIEVFETKKSTALELSSCVMDLGLSIVRDIQMLKTALLEELKTPDEVGKVLKLVCDLWITGENRFSSPDKDAFLDDPSLKFYIFREGRMTVFVIKNDRQWTSMLHHEERRREWNYRRNKMVIVPKDRPVTLTELEHLRSCYVRWTRQRSVGQIPDDFEDTPKNMRRLVASVHIKP